MLAAAEPRGLPGTVIDRVAFQRAAEGYPLDDVIVHAHDASGNAAALEIQVKRSMTFALADEVFQKVVGQIAKASGTAGFWNRRHELGIAISQSSHKIDGHGKDFGKNSMTVILPDGSEKVFLWYQTYGWSRDLGAGPSVVASALMALEAWAHGRIEKGESVDKVVAEVIGQSPAPAAYLLVAVDLLLSHWPASRTAAIPFVACPELLCIDRERVSADNFQMPDIFGLKEISREPAGLVSIESLKARPSRRSALDRLLDIYALEEYKADRPVLKDLLQKAAARLGPPQEQSDLGDPEFMVLHALNRIDPNNWREATVQTANGPEEVLEYMPPAAERDHLKPMQDEMEERNSNARMEASIRIALNNAGRSSQAFASAAVKWAQDVANKPAGNETQQWMREEAIVTAALTAARDGGADLIAAHADWIRETFRRSFKGKHDPVHRTRDGALATVFPRATRRCSRYPTLKLRASPWFRLGQHRRDVPPAEIAEPRSVRQNKRILAGGNAGPRSGSQLIPSAHMAALPDLPKQRLQEPALTHAPRR